RLGHPHRALRAATGRAVPHRRNSLRHRQTAETLPARHRLARQDHGGAPQRPEAPSPPRADPPQNRRERRAEPPVRHPPPTFGERIVMRLLDRSATLLPLDDLGLAGQNLKTVQRLIHQSHGIILVTGPTGSGKTTTLYAALQKINSNEKNIITIEDPIEYQLAGVGQMQVNPKIELTFANGLRSILRQDPDVIMVGEIRDVET